jgi:hypothetical protein
MKMLNFFESARISVIIAFAIGMGIAFHEVFLLVAFVLTMAALIHAIGQHFHQAKLTHRHP